MRNLLLTLAIAAVCAACDRTPQGVIPPGQMAPLIADLRLAGAVADLERGEYAAPARRLALADAVFERHGVTRAQYDSSLVWYGHNITTYQEVNDRAIALLEERLQAVAGDTQQGALSIAGDSVQMWPGARPWTVTAESPGRFLTFEIPADENVEPGDIFTLGAAIVTPVAAARACLIVWYTDGTVETIAQPLNTSVTSAQTLSLVTSAEHRAATIAGYLMLTPEDMRPAVADSLSLIRLRPGPDADSRALRNHQQRRYELSPDTMPHS